MNVNETKKGQDCQALNEKIIRLLNEPNLFEARQQDLLELSEMILNVTDKVLEAHTPPA